MNEPFSQSQRWSHRHSQYSVDSADQGAGGYRRVGSLRESEHSGGGAASAALRTGKRRGHEQHQYSYQQQQQMRHDEVLNASFASHVSQRSNRRQPQQLRSSGTRRASTSSRRTSLSSSYSSRATGQLDQSFAASHSSLLSEEMSRSRRGQQNARQIRAQNMQSQSLIHTRVSPRRQSREQNVQSQSLQQISRLRTTTEEEEEDDEFDTIPLVSSEYLKELISRSTTMQVNNDDSETSRLNPNNNSSEASTSTRDNGHSTLNQSMRMSTMRPDRVPHHRRPSQASSDHSSNQDRANHRRFSQGSDLSNQDMSYNRQGSDHSLSSYQDKSHHRRASRASSDHSSNQDRSYHRQGSDHNLISYQDRSHHRRVSQERVRQSFNSNQSNQNRQDILDRDIPQHQRQQPNRVASSFNERQLRQYSRRDSFVGKSASPHLFYSQQLQSASDRSRGNFDIRTSIRQPNVGPPYESEIITEEPHEVQVLTKDNQESMFEHQQRSMNVMNGGALQNVGTSGKVVREKSLTPKFSASIGKKKKVPLLGAIGVCLIVVVVIVVVTVYITTYQSSDEKPKPQKPFPEIDVVDALECNDCISKPVADIEGRCSPSNLPGSLSLCREACTEAACCYSNFDGEKCYNDTNEATLLACGEYRPHCDVFYHPWSGASKGSIPDAPISIFEQNDWDEICGSDGSARRLTTNNSSQALTCLEFCLPSKCCFAPIVQSDMTSQGLFLNQDGAYQSLDTDEYVMTSCALQNYNACSAYADACRDLIMPLSFWQDAAIFELSSISFSPSTSIMPSTSTRRPTLQPTTDRPTTRAPSKEVTSGPSSKVKEPTTMPTPPPTAKVVTVSPTISPTTLPPVAPTVVVPIADLTRIKAACTGFQNYNLIAKGEFNTRNKCRDACIDGLCCFKDLGLGIDDSCFDGNEDVCALYSDCLVLKSKPNDVLDVDINNVGPTSPTDDLTSLCSPDETSTPEGISKCFQACLPGSWCCTAAGESSCFIEFEESCPAYGPCQLMHDKYGGDFAQALPPIPPNSLEYACSYQALIELHQSDGNIQTECNRMCEAGMCCIDGTCGEGSTATEIQITDRCASYEPCRHLSQLPAPADDIETLCQDIESSQCLDVCSQASCCWVSDDDGCFSNFEQRCLSYAPYCSPSMSERGDFPAPLSPPPPDLCTSGPPSACRNACLSGPSCCFTPIVEDNCFSQNEETCGMWAKCAFLYQEADEFA